MEVFCPLFSPPTPCVAALMAPVYCILNARALQVEVQEVLYGNSSSQTVHQKQTADMHDRCIGFIPAVQCGAAVALALCCYLALLSWDYFLLKQRVFFLFIFLWPLKSNVFLTISTPTGESISATNQLLFLWNLWTISANACLVFPLWQQKYFIRVLFVVVICIRMVSKLVH